MHEQNFKFGQAIVVCGSRPCVGTSTAAAMIASRLASGGDKTLLLSTDHFHPYDAVSILSDVVTESHMEELVALENSSGLNPGNLEDYTSYISDNLAYIRLSTRLNSITRDVARTLSHILDTSCRVFRYVVLDLDYQNAIYLHKLSEQADIVTFLFSQDFQSLRVAKAMADMAEIESRDTGAIMLPVLMNCLYDIPVDEALLAKAVNTDTVIAIEHDPEVFKAVQKRDMAGFVFHGANKPGGLKGFFKKKNSDISEDTVLTSVSAICNLIKKVLQAETDGDKS